jgi:homocysteine S-methyltransferase
VADAAPPGQAIDVLLPRKAWEKADWAKKLGYSPGGLREMQHKCIDFLREVSKPYAGQLPRIAIVGCIGPRGDAYSLNLGISAEEAEDYHSIQMTTLKECDVDLVWAATINNIPEAVGISRAAASAGLPSMCHSRSTVPISSNRGRA